MICSVAVADEASGEASAAAPPDEIEDEMEEEVLFCYCFFLSSYGHSN